MLNRVCATYSCGQLFVNVLFTVCAISYHGISHEKEIFVVFPCVMGNRVLQSTSAVHFRIKPKRNRIRKCRGGRRKVRKIKVLTIIKIVMVVKLVVTLEI